MSIQDIPVFLEQNNGLAYLKYVRVNGEYRFGEVLGEHTQLANGEQVESAAFIKIYPEGFFIEGYSMRLGIGYAADDEENLSKLLNLPVKDRW